MSSVDGKIIDVVKFCATHKSQLNRITALEDALKTIVDCYGLGQSADKFTKQVGPFILDAKLLLDSPAVDSSVTIVLKQLGADQWIAACGGTEEVFKSRSGIRMLYCFQPSSGRHAYLNVDTDIIMTDEEAALALDTGAARKEQ
jgi:hypothetical protein